MAELSVQLRRYATTVLERVEAVSADEILRHSGKQRRRRRRWQAALAGAVAVAVAAAVVAWLSTTDRGSPVRVATTGGLPTAWHRLDALQDAPQIQAMASSGHALVAVGSAIWYSNDARSWTQVLDPAALGSRNPATQQASINAVTAASRGFVAGGQAVDPATGQTVAAIWSSPDGQRWTRVRDPALEPPTPPIPAGNQTPVRGSIQAITRGGPGLVAIGGVFGGTFSGGTLVTAPSDPAVWTSPDGQHWTRTDPGAVFGSRSGASPLLSLTTMTTRDGTLVLMATYRDSTSVFTSGDARHWHQTAALAGSMTNLTTYHHLLVAVGSEGGTKYNPSQRAIVWTSSDLVHWRRAVISAPAPFARYTGAAATGNSLVVVGYRGVGEPVEDATMSVSKDAKTWVAIPESGAPFAARTSLSGVTSIFGTRYVAFGVEVTSGSGSATSPFRQRTDLFVSNASG
jgi:hypothetical protein